MVIGGAGQPAFRRIARTGNGWHAINATPEQIADGIAAIDTHSPTRPVEISLRIGLALDRPRREGPGTVLEGSAEQIAEQVRAYETAGVEHLIIDSEAPDTNGVAEDLEQFIRLVRDAA